MNNDEYEKYIDAKDLNLCFISDLVDNQIKFTTGENLAITLDGFLWEYDIDSQTRYLGVCIAIKERNCDGWVHGISYINDFLEEFELDNRVFQAKRIWKDGNWYLVKKESE